MKKILFIIFIMALVSSCSYEELPPKTDDASSAYILPKGELPSATELNEQRNKKLEYNNSTR